MCNSASVTGTRKYLGSSSRDGTSTIALATAHSDTHAHPNVGISCDAAIRDALSTAAHTYTGASACRTALIASTRRHR